MDYQTFEKITKRNAPKKDVLKSALLAFFCGGFIGILAQFFIDLGCNYLNLELEQSYAFSAIIVVLLASLLTAFSLYSKLAQIFGAGLFIPTTGFANSTVSAAIEGRSEGLIQGIGAKIFVLSGSVIAYGVLVSVILCLGRYLLILLGVNL